VLGVESTRLRLFFFHSGDQFAVSTSMSAMNVPSAEAARRIVQGLGLTSVTLPR
jgi:hypothetical protein